MNGASRPFVMHVSVRVAWWLRALVWLFRLIRWLPGDRVLDWLFDHGIEVRSRE